MVRFSVCGTNFAAANPFSNVHEGTLERSTRGIERIPLTYDVEPDVPVEAYLLRHTKERKTLPNGESIGIVLFHSSGPNNLNVEGSIDAAQEASIGAQLAERGYTVICPRCFIYRPDFDGHNPRAHHLERVEEMLEKHPQWKGMGRMIWDGIRAVDVLVEHCRMHVGRIGAIGHSLGAKEVLFTMAFDSRIAAGVFCDGGIGVSFSNWEDEWYLGAEIFNEFCHDNHEILALIAPRAFLITGGKYDHDGAWPYMEHGHI
ncbi:MAG: dienelactone hydrolase family protein [Candidatus Binatia bacterium]